MPLGAAGPRDWTTLSSAPEAAQAAMPPLATAKEAPHTARVEETPRHESHARNMDRRAQYHALSGADRLAAAIRAAPKPARKISGQRSRMTDMRKHF